MKSIIPQYYKSTIRIEENAIRLRKNETPAEKHLWKMLRNRNLLGLKFRRQHPIARFIADFYCAELKLVIEIDGSIHEREDIIKYDLERENYLKELGLKVLRFKNEDVFLNPEIIEKALREILGE